MGPEPASVRGGHLRAFVCPHFQTSISLRPADQIQSNFMKHHRGRGKATLGFGADQVRTLVSTATDGSHRVIKGKTVYFSSDRFILEGKNDMHEISDEFEIQPDTTSDCGVNCP